MLRYADAISMLIHEVSALTRTERVGLGLLDGRVLAADVAAPFSQPPFVSAAMDGYALSSDATKGASAARPVSLEVAGRIYAGDAAGVSRGDAAYEISTGAALRDPLDAVVRREDAVVSSDRKRLLVSVPIARLSDARAAGEDFMEGASVVRRGTRVTPAVVMALAALGVKEAVVFARPRVVIVTTGNELVRVGSVRRASAIFDCNGPTLAAMLGRVGCEVTLIDCLPDEPDVAFASLREVDADLVLTVGAVSEGERDFVPALAERLGAKPLFHKVAIRPGKPVFAATLGRTVWLGLPGNPVAAVVDARFFAFPALRSLLAMPQERAAMLPLAGEQALKAPLLHFLRAQLEPSTGEVTCAARQASHLTSSLLHAGVWALCEGGRRYAAHERVPTFPLYEFGQGEIS